MIQTEAGFRSAKEALGLVESALGHLRQDATRYHPETFAALQEPLLDEIDRLQTEIRSYTPARLGGMPVESPQASVVH